jgi:orotate phosphoribosyltransferase
MRNRRSFKQLRKELFFLLKRDAYRQGRVVLSSGKFSNYYIDARTVTLSSKGSYLAASLILHLIRNKYFSKEKIRAVGGPTLGADPLVGAVATLSFLDKKPLDTFIVRKSPKTHGRKRRIEGPELRKKDRVVLVDDVATSGNSLIDCVSVLKGEGIKVCGAIVIIDREEGAEEKLSQFNCPLISIFKASEFRKK